MGWTRRRIISSTDNRVDHHQQVCNFTGPYQHTRLRLILQEQDQDQNRSTVEPLPSECMLLWCGLRALKALNSMTRVTAMVSTWVTSTIYPLPHSHPLTPLPLPPYLPNDRTRRWLTKRVWGNGLCAYVPSHYLSDILMAVTDVCTFTYNF